RHTSANIRARRGGSEVPSGGRKLKLHLRSIPELALSRLLRRRIAMLREGKTPAMPLALLVKRNLRGRNPSASQLSPDVIENLPKGSMLSLKPPYRADAGSRRPPAA